ncbi:Dipeptidyl aminopeptidase/acylaminoacyl peptidase [Nannocystis exedens]|uniref:Acyl-peptide hydrolase n=1 Tax=Nannocystis exedens TaxID=54 RepID=A0A1I2G659_9BACT|nr:S9 family peptidase [Nannocystis exedens]PCC67254.1 peptidase S9 [Nannocystis exedens]SFF13115.1 Dipeptidyl aminopeptidase/acylaminoacyl peptidase [Nannocystis exedens]
MPTSTRVCLLLLAVAACDAPPAKDAPKVATIQAKRVEPAGTADAPPADTGRPPDSKSDVPPVIVPGGPAEDSVVSMPDSLTAENIPPIPRAIADGVGTYSEARSALALEWHPKDHSLLIRTRFADTDQVHEVKMAGGDRRQLTFFSDRVGGATYPPVGDGGFFVLSKDIGGNEFAQNWRFDRADGKLTLLTDGASKNSLGPWTRAGDRFAYTSTRRNKKDTDFYVVDPRDPSSDKLVAEVEGGGWSPQDFSADGNQLLALEYVSVNESYLWLFDLATGERTKLTEKTGDVPVAWSGASFTADGKGVITTTDGKGEFRELVTLDLASKQTSPLGPPVQWDVDSFAVSHDRKKLASVVNEGGIDRLRLHDLPSGRERPIKTRLPAGTIGGLNFHPDGKLLAFTLSSARSPADTYVLDVQSGVIERWTESEVGTLNPATFSEPELVTWKSFDGREIPGFYYKPPARFTGKRPVVVIVHGGPEGQSQTGFIGRNNYYLNELGVALLYPNVRGSTGYGKTYVRLDNGAQREDSVKDLGAALDWIASRPDLDAERVMIMGGSYGGYMTLAASVHFADRIRCAVDIVGISNFVTFLENTEAYRRDLRRAEYGDERDPELRKKLLEISPLTRAAEIKKPLFVIQGKNDPRVPASEAHQIVATLKQGGTPVWYLEGKDEGHGFQKKRNQDYQMYATILFMKKFLLDGMSE